jgi:hypothetical protein
MAQLPVIKPGDIVVVSQGKGWTSRLIRIGSALRGQANAANHVAIMHHYTGQVPWGVEGRPGGVGWVDMRKYLSNKRIVTNAAQPKSDAQRATLGIACEAILGKPYDWSAIFTDALDSIGLKDLWNKDWDKQGVPGHVVCSSAAALVYKQCELAHPNIGHERYVSPGDWAGFCYDEGWKVKP